MKTLINLLNKPILSDKRFIFSIWMGLALIAGLKHAFRAINNNYLIFKYTFYNLIDQVNLYAQYSEKYFDSNHYGPVFGVLMAPFALLPDGVGTIVWELAMAGVLLWAIYKLPIKWQAKVVIYWITMHEVYLSAVNSQTNTLIAALIIGSFICIRSEKDFWGACFIMLGAFIKLYGIVGLAFFFFSKNKIKFIVYLFVWAGVFFTLPMFFSSPEFVLQSYIDWFNSLTGKNIENLQSTMQNISVIGMMMKLTSRFDISALIILIPALFVFALQYIQIKSYHNITFQLGILASTLLFVVLFSTGSESCTYVIAAVGAGLWYVLQAKPRSNYVITVLVLIIISYLSTTDLSPAFWKKEIFRPYALKSLPFLIVWLTLAYQLMRFSKTSKTNFTGGDSLLEGDIKK